MYIPYIYITGDGADLNMRQSKTTMDPPMMAEGTGAMLWCPVEDDDVVVRGGALKSLKSGTNKNVPLMIGWCSEEFKMFGSIPGFGAPSSRAKSDAYLVSFLRSYYNRTRSMDPDDDEKWKAFALDLFDLQKDALDDRNAPSDAQSVNIAAATNIFFMFPILETAYAHVEGGGDAYVYQFDYKSEQWGASHAIDIAFVFNTFVKASPAADYLKDFNGDCEKRPEMHSLAADVGETWTTFARNGDPSNDAIGMFPHISSGKIMMMGSGKRAKHTELKIGSEWDKFQQLDLKIKTYLSTR